MFKVEFLDPKLRFGTVKRTRKFNFFTLFQAKKFWQKIRNSSISQHFKVKIFRQIEFKKVMDQKWRFELVCKENGELDMCQAFEQWTFLKKGIPRVTTFFRVVLGGHLTFLLPSINVKNSNHREPSSYLLSSRAILRHLFSRAMHRKWLLDLQKNVRTTREILSLFFCFSKIVLDFVAVFDAKLEQTDQTDLRSS